MRDNANRLNPPTNSKPYARDLVEEIRSQLDIVHVIAQYLPIDGQNKALCPFHQESNPSFSVNSKGQYFHCFGCGVGGDVFKFLELIEHKTFRQVLEEQARRFGVDIAPFSAKDRGRIDEKRAIEKVLAETIQYHQQNLPQAVKDYLTKERGLTEEIIQQFRIGYASGGLYQHLVKDLKLPLELCLKAGVLKKYEDGSIRDFFHNRIVLPNIKRGQVVHISARSLNGSVPKYLNLPGEISHLYNEDALCENEIYVTEGVFDCLKAVQVGLPTVAILGASGLKFSTIGKFKHCKRVFLCLDGDDAGRDGALKLAGFIGNRARIIQLPDGQDLNDFLNAHSREELGALAAAAPDIIRYELNLIPPDADKADLPQLLARVIEQLAEFDIPTREAYLREIKSRFSLNSIEIEGYRELVINQRIEQHDCKTEQLSDSEDDPEHSAYFEGLVDLVEEKGMPAFLIKDSDNVSIVTRVEKDGIIYIPPRKEQIPWLLPRGQEVLKYCEQGKTLSKTELDGALYNALLEYHKAISDLPGEYYYDLVVAWDFHTYLLEQVQYSPIICLFAVPERGKSRTGKSMIHVAYRGIHVESLRDAYLVRVANDLKASVFFDVRDIWRKAEKNGSEDILLHRFEKGAQVPRVLYPDRGAHQDIKYYSVFGPTVISTNEGVHRILETRAVQINMPETRRQFENDVMPELALPLKEQLVAFRARHLGETLLDIPKPASSRLGDILKPILQIVRLVKPEREGHLMKLVKELESDRMIDKSDSFEAHLLKVILDLKDNVERGILSIKLITDTFNEDKQDRFQITYQRVGRRLSAMGFKKGKNPDGASAIIWDSESIERMEETYGLRKTSETSETSETSDYSTDDTDVSGDTDVSRKVF